MSKKKSRLNIESLAIVIVMLVATPLAFIHPDLARIITYPAQFIWMLIWVGQSTAGGAFLARFFDFVFNQASLNKNDEISKKSTWQIIKSRLKSIYQNNLGEVLGFLMGLSVSIAIIISQVLYTPILATIDIFTLCFFTSTMLLTLNRVMGFFNRAFGVVDFAHNAKKDENFWRKKDINFILSICAGLLLGSALIATFFSVVGTTAAIGTVSAMCGLTGIPAMLFFSLITLSSIINATSNIGRWFDLVFGDRAIFAFINDWLYEKEEGIRNRRYLPTPEKRDKHSFQHRFQKAPFESSMLLIGVPLGFATGIVLSALLLTGVIVTLHGFPFMFGAAFPAIIATPLIISGCTGPIGGLFQRLGRFLDNCSGEFEYQSSGNKEESPKQYTSVFETLIDREPSKKLVQITESSSVARLEKSQPADEKIYAYAYGSAGFLKHVNKPDVNPSLRKLLETEDKQEVAVRAC